MTAPTGWDLVAAAQAGDRDAFGQLYERYAGPVARVVMARTGDRDLTDDLTSETFTRALHRIDTVHDGGRDVGGWLKAIARNMTVDHFRSSRFQRERVTADLPDHASDDRGPEQTVINQETAAELHRHIAQLSPVQQECLRLRFWEDLSSKETAAVMGRAEVSIRGLRHRAITALRASLTAADSEAGPSPHGGPVPLAQARRAVTEVAQHVADTDPTRIESDRAQQLSRWHADDHADELPYRGLDREAVADTEGVA